VNRQRKHQGVIFKYTGVRIVFGEFWKLYSTKCLVVLRQIQPLHRQNKNDVLNSAGN